MSKVIDFFTDIVEKIYIKLKKQSVNINQTTIWSECDFERYEFEKYSDVESDTYKILLKMEDGKRIVCTYSVEKKEDKDRVEKEIIKNLIRIAENENETN